MNLRIVALVLVVLLSSTSHAAIVHQYTFNDGTARDVVSGANGVLYGAASVHGGQLHLDGGLATDPNGVAYVDLPNGIVAELLPGEGPYGVTFEAWVTVEITRTWAPIYGFSAGANQLDEEFFGNASPNWWFQLNPNEGHVVSEGGCFTCGPFAPDSFPRHDQPLPTVIEKHVAVTLNVVPKRRFPDRDPGSIASSLYVDGRLVDTATPTSEFHELLSNPVLLSSMNNSNNWIGRSTWTGSNEPYFNGSINEFRIHNTALSADEVMASYLSGPTSVPEPSAIVCLTMLAIGGAARVVARRRASRTRRELAG